MNYCEAIEYIHAIPKFVRPLGNEKLSGLLNLLGNPHQKLRFVHIAGTNGKGSVSAMTAKILECAGYKTGLFTSPYIEVFNERIRINGEMIEDFALADYVTKAANIMLENDISVSEFAFITAVAMSYFADSKCDIVVLETGMGGRLDATNIIPPPLCSVITSISLDHTQYLGEAIEEIALEKCGIIKSGSIAVTSPNPETVDIIKAYSKGKEVPLTVCQRAQKTETGFIYKGIEYPLALKGAYQAENAATVLETVYALQKCGFDVSETAIIEGFKSVSWQARYEFITPDIVIDGGHNKDGIRVLKESLLSEKRPVTLVMAMMSDKDYEECVSDIITIADRVYSITLDMPRSLAADEIKRICDREGVECIVCKDTESALLSAVNSRAGGLVCVCGSLYLAGEARLALKRVLSE